MNYYEPVPGLRLPAAAMGCMRIAEMEYGALERQVLLAAELGMNFFDHADFYGEFRSEARFGEVLARNPGLREKIYVQSKCGIRIGVPFPVSWTVKMKKKQKETQDILSYHTQAAGCSDKARAKASGGRQPIEECGRTGL